MKKVVILGAIALLALGLNSCEDDKGKVLDPNAKISIKPAAVPQGVDSKSVYPTPLEVVQKTTDLMFQSHEYPNEPYCNVGVSEEQKDVVNLRIMMWGEQIIRNGELNPFFIEAYDVVFITRDLNHPQQPITDTLAYISNVTLRSAETAIKAAFVAENYDEVYRLFDEAYRFTPINGADWLELKRQGNN